MIPLKNTDPEDLEDEKWKWIPGFEKLYQLSNFGRTRSITRKVYISTGRAVTYTSRILKPRIALVQRKNGSGLLSVQVEVNTDGQRTMISIARYVYYLFVKKFNLSDRTVIIKHQDGNKLNCACTNLEMQAIGDFLRDGYAAERGNSFKNNIRPVIQYTVDGKRVAKYNSAKDASAALGIPSRYINHAASTETRKAGGFLWKYGKRV